MENGKPSKSWTASAFDREKGEWVHTMNHSYDNTAIEFDASMLIQQTPAIKVTPSRRKPATNEFDEKIATIGDIHFPFQNQRKLDLCRLGLRILEPTHIDLLGDNLDSPNYSRFGTRKEWADATQQGIEEYAQFLGQLRADHPEAVITWHEGNHDQRQELRIREYNEDLLGIKRAGEALTALSLDFLLRLDELDVNLIKGYPSGRRVVTDKHDRPQLEIYHGHVTSGNFAMSKVLQTAFVSQNTGHTHNLGIVSKTFFIGNEERTIYGAESGTFANSDLTPSGKYAPGKQVRHDWHSGIIDWVVDEDGARPNLSTISNNEITVHSRSYKS